MRTLVVLLTLGLLALPAAAPVAVAQDPCPSSCTPPEPCGWAPDIRKYPTQWAGWAVGCAEELLA